MDRAHGNAAATALTWWASCARKGAFCVISVFLVLAASTARATPDSQAPVASGSGAVSLDEAVRITLRLLPAVAQAQAGLESAEARVVQMRSAYLPNLNAQLGYTRQTANFVLRPGILPQTLAGSAQAVTSLSRSFNYFSGQLVLSQLVYDFGASQASIKAARAAVVLNHTMVSEAMLQAVGATRRAFFTAQGKKWLAYVAEQNHSNTEAHRIQTAKQVALEMRPKVDLVRADTDVSLAEVAAIGARNDCAIAMAALMQAMGVEGLIDFDIVSDESLPPVAKEASDENELVQEAIGARPCLRGQAANFLGQQHTVRSIAAGFLPQISVTGSVTEAGQDLARLAWNYSGGATLSWPLLAGGDTYGKFQEARAQARAAQASWNATRNAVAMEVRTAALGVRGNLRSIEAAQQAAVSATQQLQLAKKRYQTGLGGALEVGDAQLAWATAQSQLVQARVDLSIARASLLQALGRT